MNAVALSVAVLSTCVLGLGVLLLAQNHTLGLVLKALEQVTATLMSLTKTQRAILNELHRRGGEEP